MVTTVFIAPTSNLPLREQQLYKMIDQILKDRKPEDKPRFFLHDEMKAWLTEHLKFNFHIDLKHAYEHSLAVRLGVLAGSFPVAMNTQLKVYIDDEMIASKDVTNSFPEYTTALKTLVEISDISITRIKDLIAENQELKRRIDLLENPPL